MMSEVAMMAATRTCLLWTILLSLSHGHLWLLLSVFMLVVAEELCITSIDRIDAQETRGCLKT
jgi:hypothetical protein